MKRTDAHRKGAIVPGEYRFVLCYSMAHDAYPSWGVDCTRSRWVSQIVDGALSYYEIPGKPHAPEMNCCLVALAESGRKFADHGRAGNCTACGTGFYDGEVWEHIPTGELAHFGMICAEKYNLLRDRSADQLALGRHKEAAAVEVTRKKNAEARIAFFSAHPGLEADLKLDHRILADLSEKLFRFLSLSPAQIALAAKIANEIRNPKPGEAKVAAPVTSDRVLIRGTVVSLKEVEAPAFGYRPRYAETDTILKMVVRVQTPEGSWAAWGTVPSALASERVTNAAGETVGYVAIQKGDVVEFSAKLQPGREASFAFFSRPTKARFVSRVPDPKEVALAASVQPEPAAGPATESSAEAPAGIAAEPAAGRKAHVYSIREAGRLRVVRTIETGGRATIWSSSGLACGLDRGDLATLLRDWRKRGASIRKGLISQEELRELTAKGLDPTAQPVAAVASGASGEASAALQPGAAAPGAAREG